MSVWLTLLAAGIAGYVTRALPLVVTLPSSTSDRGRRYLDALPIAIVAALAGSGVALPNGAPTHGAELGAAVAVVVVARWRRELVLALMSGVLVAALLRALGL